MQLRLADSHEVGDVVVVRVDRFDDQAILLDPQTTPGVQFTLTALMLLLLAMSTTLVVRCRAVARWRRSRQSLAVG